MKKLITASVLLWAAMAQAREWSLRDCIAYALKNNIRLRKHALQRQGALEDLGESRAALLPSISAAASQSVSYTPWPETGSYVLAGDRVQTHVDKVYYNGGYSVNGSLTVWDGNRSRNRMRSERCRAEQAALDSAATACGLQEQIARLYVQILYAGEAIEVARQTLRASADNEERGRELVRVGSMSRADLARLTAQRAQDEYALVEAESSLKDGKRQLRQLLRLTGGEPFEVVVPEATDGMALRPVPDVASVYERALAVRPEIRSALLGMKAGDLQVRTARAQRMPTVTATAGVGTSTTTMGGDAWGRQLKTNFGVTGGLSVSVPILDNRRARTAVGKAVLARQEQELELMDRKDALYAAIEDLWLQAVNNQARFRSARAGRESAQASFDLLTEQFRQKLRNTTELMDGKNLLAKARQDELQAKYMAILCIDLLNFYGNGTAEW